MVNKMLRINTDKLLNQTSEKKIFIKQNNYKINLKVHKADLDLIDAIASKFNTSRSNIITDMLKELALEKAHENTTEFDSKILIARVADYLSPQEIVDGRNDLEESWLYEIVRDEIKQEINHRYNYYKLSEQDVCDPRISDEVETLRHSDEHNTLLEKIKERI